MTTTKITPGYLLPCALAGFALAVFLVNRQQYHQNTVNRGLLAYGWFSPQVEKVLTTDFFVPAGAEGAGTVRSAKDLTTPVLNFNLTNEHKN